MEPIIKRIECNVPCSIEFHADGSVTICSLGGNTPPDQAPQVHDETTAKDSAEQEREKTRNRVRRWREKRRSKDGSPKKAPSGDVERNEEEAAETTGNANVTLGNAECNARETLKNAENSPQAAHGNAKCNTRVTLGDGDESSECCCYYLNKNKQQQQQQEIDIKWHIPEILATPEFLEVWMAYCTWRNARGGAATLSRGGMRQRAETTFLQDLEEIANLFGVEAAVLTLHDTRNAGWVNRLHHPPTEQLRECATRKAQTERAQRNREMLNRFPMPVISFLQNIENSGTIGVLQADPTTLSEIAKAVAANSQTEEIEAWDAMWTPLHAPVTFLTEWDSLDEESREHVLEKLGTVVHGGVVILTTDGGPVEGAAFCEAGQMCAIS